jgi:hypothetical protein
MTIAFIYCVALMEVLALIYFARGMVVWMCVAYLEPQIMLANKLMTMP